MRNRKLLSLVAAVVATAALAVVPAAGAVRLPRLPRPPKVTTYEATLDVAGYIDVKAERDTTGECQPGQDVTIDFESSFELGRPRSTQVTVVNGAVVSGLVRRTGSASHKGTLSGYRETNYCPPTKKVEQRAPTCTSHSGRLQAVLGTDADDFKPTGPDDLAPLAYPVSVVVHRFGGGSQDSSCARYLSSGIRAARPKPSSALGVLEGDHSGLVIPIGATDRDFLRLKAGETLRRVVTLNGACDHVLLGSAAPARASRRYDRTSKCTVRGRIYIAVKRIS